MAAGSARGATNLWDAGSSTDFNWDTALNWSTNLRPISTDDLLFPTPAPNPGSLATPLTITLGAGEAANSLTFRDSYTLTGGALSLTSSLITVAPGAIVSLGSALTATDLTLAVSNGLTGGNVQGGGGVLVLGNASNNLTGITSINAGTLRVANATALGTSNTVNSGGTLEVAGVALDRNMTLNDGATLLGTGTTSSSTGVMTVASGATVSINSGAAGQTFTLGNAANDLTGGGAGTTINVGGAGQVTLAQASNVTASWNVNNGRLQLGSLSALGASANTVSVNSGATLGVTLTASGPLPNAVTLNGGTLSNSSAFQLTFSSPLTVTAASTLDTAVSGSSGKILLSANQLAGSGNITKTGPGTLQITGNSAAYTGSFTVSGGFLEASAGAIGANTVTVNSGELVASNGILANNIVINGGAISGDNGTSTFTGAIAANANFNVNLKDFYQNTARSLNILGPISGSGNINVTALAGGNTTLTLLGDLSAWTGALSVPTSTTVALPINSPLFAAGRSTWAAGSSLALRADGDGTGSPETLDFAASSIPAGLTNTLNVDRVGNSAASPLWLQAANKTIRITGTSASFAGAAQSFTATVANGFGIELAGDATLSGTATYSVSGSGSSYVVPGLTISGALSGTGTFVKSNTGTLVLTNSANSFGGAGTVLDITQGVLAVANDGALGNAGNIIRLNPSTGTSTFRALGDITTAHVIRLQTGSNTRSIEVADGKTLTLNSGLDIASGANTAGLVKADTGTLVLTAAPTTASGTWDGALSINGGAVRVTSAAALGSATGNTVVANNVGAALQLSGGITITEPLNLSNSGINTGGALQSFSGSNVVTSTVTLGNDATIGANNSATLKLGAITGAGKNLTLAGDGAITLSSTFSTTAASSITKIGGGSVTVAADLSAATAFTGNLTVSAGSFTVGSAGVGKLGGTGTITVNPGAVLNAVDTTAVVGSRLGGRALTLAGGTLSYTANGTSASTEALGALTLNPGGSVINLTNGGSAAGTLSFGSFTANAGSTVNFMGALGGPTNQIKFATAPTLTPASTGILPRATVGGIDFATYGTNGVAAFTGYNATSTTNINSAGANDTVKVTTGFVSSLTGSRTINALNVTGNGLTVGAAANGAVLTLSSGGLLVTGGADTISSGLTVATGASEALLYVNALASLQFNGALTGSAGLTKALGGSLTFGAPQAYAGATTLNGGSLVLAGGTNTLPMNTALIVNPGGSLDLKGTAQYVGNLSSQGSNRGAGIAGGVITSSTGAGLLVTNTTANPASFAGTISGANVGFARSGTNVLNILAPQTYGGATLINGGATGGSSTTGTILADDGALSNTSSITINYATLSLDNSRLSDNSNRLNDSAPITLNGGVLNLFGRGLAFSSEKVGGVTLAQGSSVISSANGSNGLAPEGSTLTLASLGRNAAAGATVTFGTNYSGTAIGTSSGALGRIDDGAGKAENIIVTGGVALKNNIVGPWAIVDSYFPYSVKEFASYNDAYGVGALNAPGFAGYHGTTIPTGNQAAQNIRITSSSAVPVGGSTINTLNFAVTTASTAANLSFSNANDVLNLAGGGLLIQDIVNGASSTASIGASADSGRLTAGGTNPTGVSDLYLHYTNTTAANKLTINSRIIDNPTNNGAVRFIPWGGNWGASTIVLASNQNSYSGGTVINQETLEIGSAAAPGNLPGGGVTINGGTLAQINGVITPQSVTINGGGVLSLLGNNSLTDLTINNTGGASNPTVNAGGILTLTGGGLLSTSSNVGTVASILGGILDFNGASALLNVDSITVNGQSVAASQASLNITSVIRDTPGFSTGLTKTGGGALQLFGGNTFTGGVALNAGTLIGSVSSSGTLPFGTGAVAMNGGSLSILGGIGANGTVLFGNDVTVNSAQPGAVINVNNTGAAANNTNVFQMGTLTMAGGQTLNVTGGNNHVVRFSGTNFSGSGSVNFNPAAGVGVAVVGTTTGGLLPVNTGTGTLLLGGNFGYTSGTNVTTSTLLGAAPVANSVNTPFGSGQTVTLNSGVTFPIVPTAGMPDQSLAGYTQGGLTAKFYAFGATANLNSVAGSGQAPAGVLTGQLLGDTGSFNHPPVVTAATPQVNSISVYSGLVKIDTGGVYTFQTAEDDQSQLVIDGVTVTAVNTTASGGGKGETLLAAGVGSINLAPGYHSIVFKQQNATGGGGFQVLYSGPDTASNGLGATGPIPGLQAIPGSKLYWTTDAPTAANNYLSAAQINDAFVVPASASVTLDGQGSDIHSTLASLSIGNSSTLTVNNQLGTGTIGVVGATTVGTGVTLSPNSGALNLIGGLGDSGAGVTKTGTGTLILGKSTAFTGPFAVNVGAVQLADASGLTAGTTTVANGAWLDLNGVSGVSGTIAINGVPSTNKTSVTPAALYNSSPFPASVAGKVLIGAGTAAATAIGGYGDITLNGQVNDGVAGTAWSKVGPDVLTLNGANGFTGALTISAGTVKLGNAAALGTAAGATTVSSGATLDLGGQAVTLAEALNLNGAGMTGIAAPNQLGALINSGAAASYAGNIALQANSSVGSNSVALTGSATDTPAAGDITLSGVLSGGFTLTKVGGNTLYLTNGANTANGYTVSLGTVRLQGNGAFTTANQTNTVSTGGTVVLDNSGTNVNNRFGGRGLFTNGNLTIIGNGSAATSELINQGNNNFAFQNSASVITLAPNAAQPLTVTVTTGATGLFNRSAGATTLVRGDGLGTVSAPTAGKATLTGTGTSVVNTNTGQIIGQNGAAGSKNRGIMPWVLVDTSSTGSGVSFGAFSSTNGIQALQASDYDTALSTNSNVKTSAALTAANGMTVINSLTLDAGGGLTIGTGNTIQLDSGGVLATSSATIGGAGTLSPTNSFNREIIIHTAGAGTTLGISPVIYSAAGGLTKAGAGTLQLNAAETYLGNTTVNGGLLKLAGGDNTIFRPLAAGPSAGNSGAGVSGQVLQVNLGGTLDLNGNDQQVANFSSAGTLPNTGGTITNSSATAAAFRSALNANQTFAGSITGNLSFQRDGNNTLAFTAPNTYTGSTLLTGGVTSLVDLGTLGNTSGIAIRRGVLRWDDTGIQAVTNRLPSNAPLTLDGGAFVFNPRSGTNGVATLGSVALNSGASLFQINPLNGTGAIVLAAMPTRVAGQGATVAFTSNGSTGSAGQGIGDNGRVFLTSAPTLTNGMIGGWATAIGTDPGPSTANVTAEFATYDPASGIRLLGSYAQTLNATSGTTVPAYSAATNLRLQGGFTATLPSGGLTLNSLALTGQSGGITVAFANAADTLTLTSGGLLGGLESQGRALGTTSVPGQLTAGAGQQELFIHNGANTFTINSKIVDNGAPLTVVLDAMSQTANNPTITFTNQNAYTGDTYVNGVIVNLNTTGGLALGNSGKLIISGGTNNGADSASISNSSVNLQQSDQIASGKDVVINGGAQLNLNGFNNTIGSLSFTSDGGSNGANGPAVFTGLGSLTVSGVIKSSNLSNTFNIPVMNGFLDVTGGQTFDVAPSGVAGQVGLQVNSVMAGGSITKIGAGVLAVGGQSTYAGATNVNAGTLALGANNAFLGNSRVVVAPGAVLDTRGFSGTIGSLTGTGVVTNYSQGTGGTLSVGFDNTDSTFGGTFTNTFVGGALNLTKIGSGDLNISADSSGGYATGAITVNNGSVTLDSATGRLGFGAEIVNSGGVLNLDNRANNLSNRMGGTFVPISPSVTGPVALARSLQIQGGAVNVYGPSSGNLTEGFGNTSFQNGSGTLTIIPGTGGTNIVTFNTVNGIANNGAVGGTLLLRGPGLGGTPGAGVANFVTSNGVPQVIGGGGAAGSTTISIRPDILGDTSVTGSGTGFVTYVAGTGFRLLNPATELAPTLTAGSTANVAPAASANFNGNTTVNSLTLNSVNLTATGGGVSGQNYGPQGTLAQLIVSSGGILAFGNNTISGGQLTTGATNQLIIHALGDLNVTSVISGASGSQGLVKAGAGTLTMSSPEYYTGTTTVNGGTLVLNGGQANTLMVAPTATTPSMGDLRVNAGVVNLNGFSQAVGALSNNDPLPNAGGSITNTAATPATLTTSTGSNTTFSGAIANTGGALSLTKAGGGTLTLTSANGYTGATTVIGGGLTLRDSGALTGTTGVTINYATLTQDNSGLYNIPARLPAGVPITLNGGTFSSTARQTTGDSQTLGQLTVSQGAANVAVNMYNSANQTSRFTMTFAGLTRSGGTTVNFTNGGGQYGSTSNNQGGTNPALFFTAAPTLTNNLIGGWAVINGTNFATYLPGRGIGEISNTGAGFANYDSTDITTAAATANVNDGSNRSLTATKTINSLRVAPNAANTLTLGATGAPITLTIASGGLLTNNNTTYSIADGGNAGSAITSGTGELDVFVNQNTSGVNVNVTGAIALVKSGGGQLNLNPPTATGNTYTGGTVVNQGTLNLNGSANVVALPAGGVTIANGATLTTNGAGGQIHPSNVVTFNGGGTLTLPNVANTLAGLVFNNIGGGTTPSTATGTVSLTLTASNAITSVNDNPGTTPTISGTALSLSDVAPVITTSGASPIDLIISAPLTSTAAITKSGPGSLVLSGSTAHPLAGGLNISQGSVIFDNTAATNAYGTAGITLGNGATILAGTSARTISNPIAVSGDFTFGGTTSSNNLTLSNTVTLAAGAHTVSVANPLVTAFVTGKLTGGTDFTKSGRGILVLSNTTNDFGGSTNVSNGVLKLGAAGAIPDASALTVNTGAAFDMAGFDETIGSLAGGGLVANSGGGKTLTVGGNDADTTFSGAFASASVNLTKVGAGVLTLTGSNTLGNVNVTRGSGNSTVEFAGNGVSTATTVNVGVSGTGTATLNIKDNHALTAINFSIGEQGGQAGTVNQTGGSVTATGAFRFGHYPNETSVYNLSGGSFNLTGTPTGAVNISGVGEQNGVLYIGIDGTAVFNMSGGSASANAIVLDGRTATTGVDTFTLTGGAFTLGSNGIKVGSGDAAANIASMAINLGGGKLGASADWSSVLPMTLTGDGGSTTIDTSDKTVTLSGALTGAGGLNKSGTGVLNLSGTNTYAGATNVNAGTLLVSGALSGTVNVNESGKLSGNGTFTGPVNALSGGVLAPGNGVGTMTLNNAPLSIGTGVVYSYEAGSAASDLIKLTGASSSLSFSGAWTLQLSNLDIADPFGKTFVLFDGDTAAAAIASFGSPTIDYSLTNWSGGTISIDPINNDIVLTNVIPEPSAGMALLMGAGSMLGLRRFRRRS